MGMVSRGWCCYLLVALVGASAVGQDDELTVNVKVLQTDSRWRIPMSRSRFTCGSRTGMREPRAR